MRFAFLIIYLSQGFNEWSATRVRAARSRRRVGLTELLPDEVQQGRTNEGCIAKQLETASSSN